jgi:hypothetical protein
MRRMIPTGALIGESLVCGSMTFVCFVKSSATIVVSHGGPEDTIPAIGKT